MKDLAGLLDTLGIERCDRFGTDGHWSRCAVLPIPSGSGRSC
ncbi:MAG: hypothetical protein R3E53_11830 [Myxococcota bacterium]